MKKKYTRGEIAKIILKSLVVGGLFITVLALPGLAQIYTLFQPKNAVERGRIKRAVYNLQNQKIITMHKKDGKEIVEITQKGKKRILAYNLEDMEIKKPKQWDGFWRIVIFDIPENKRRAREAINGALKNIHFYPLQKSTFIFPYPCKNEIDFIGEYFDVRKNIIYIKAKEIESGKQLKKHFGLS
mgnify:CR=1 FL=1